MQTHTQKSQAPRSASYYSANGMHDSIDALYHEHQRRAHTSLNGSKPQRGGTELWRRWEAFESSRTTVRPDRLPKPADISQRLPAYAVPPGTVGGCVDISGNYPAWFNADFGPLSSAIAPASVVCMRTQCGCIVLHEQEIQRKLQQRLVSRVGVAISSRW